ncbi:nucleotidyl transferase AbiEii/AbiGii toxin family protein [Candidatus Saganbacteria bacterium]|nr:nucleotidyl transferase AbiEii/AbiGii toxin family protein [Candidatus Saganbacteria bacterium]
MEILNPLQKELLDNFGLAPDSHLFYLTGGTALAAFYLRHRKSNDLDFFTAEENIIQPFSFSLEKELKERDFLIDRSRGLGSFVELAIKKGGKSTLIHLAQDSPFRFEPSKASNEFPKIKIDSLVDIASNKLLALFGRATLRDFIDVYFLVKEGYFTKEKLMGLSKEKDPGFDLYWLGVAFERINTFSANSADMLLLVKECEIGKLSEFFNSWRESISKDLLR